MYKIHNMAVLQALGIVLTILLGTVTSQRDLVCEEGWEMVGSRCFRFFTDQPLTVHHAMETCHMHGSRLAYAEDNTELAYMMRKVQNQTVYSWKVGYKSFYSSFKGVTTYYVPDFDNGWKEVNNSFVFPPFQMRTDPSLKCVAYHPKYSQSTFSREPCKVLLPYLCSGNENKAVGANYSSKHWTQYKGNAYFLSGPDDRRSRDDAQHSCNEKGLTLMDISSDIEKFIGQLINAWEDHAAWWCGLSVNGDSYSWSDGTPANKSAISFKPESTNGNVYWMMMATGAVRPDPRSHMYTRPYICKKSAFPRSNFNCPVTWYRAGQSCYYVSQKQRKSQSDASETCAKMGGHLLTITSKDERLWFETSSFLSSAYNGAWTSLNDIDSENTFVWYDGSGYDPSLITWKHAMTTIISYYRLIAEGRACAGYDPQNKEIFTQRCENRLPIGCQYKLKDGAVCAAHWKGFKGICYKTDNSFSDTTEWSTNLAACFSSLADIDSTITPEYIKINSTELVDFFKDSVKSWFWTGLNTVSTPGVYRWTDGTQPDYSIFSVTSDPDNGGSDGNQDCVVIHQGAIFEDVQCSDLRRFVCEKEVPYVGLAGQGQQNGGGAFPRGTSVFVMTCALFVCLWFVQLKRQ